MKILLVTQYFYPENFKGNDIAFEMQKKGHEVTVLTESLIIQKVSFSMDMVTLKEEEKR